ncbi:MAG: carboxypeptidase-like regulatory domain-containing protein, partial [Phycisphaerales bacterium]|nr:carboxypeptidase-like regulatory domain-containing protein [Phycisphaerales bacterium]
LEKLRTLFARRGFAVPAAMLTATLFAQSAKAIPAGLAATVAVPASATPAVVGIAKGAAWMMKLAVLKWAAAACVALLVATGVIVPLAATPPATATPVATTAPTTIPASIPASVPKKQFTYHAILRDEAGKPIANAKAWLESIDDLNRNNIRIEAQTTSGPDGSITLGPVEGLAPPFARRIAVVDAPGKAWAYSLLLGNPHEDRPVEQIVAVAPKSVAGTVVNEDGQPIEGAIVSLPDSGMFETFAFSKASGRAVTTDRLGRFLIPRVLADSRVHVLVEAPSYVTYLTYHPHSSSAAYIPAGAQDVEIVLKRGASITVQLTKDGQPYRQPGVIVACDYADGEFWFLAPYAVSNDEGLAVFDGLEPGRYTFRTAKGGGGAPVQDQLVGRQSEAITVQAGETRSVEVACVQGRLIRGQVVREGNTAEQTVLWIHSADTRWWREKYSIEIPPDGRFTAVVSDGRYFLRLQDNFIVQDQTTLLINGKPQQHFFQIDEGPATPPATPIDLELRLEQTRYRLVDSQGRGIAGVVSDGMFRIETDPDGRFICPRYKPSDQWNDARAVIAWDRQKKLAKVFDASKQLPESDIRLEPTAEIHGQLELPPGSTPEDVKNLSLTFEGVNHGRISLNGVQEHSGHYFWKTHINPNGEFRISSVPVGLDTRVSGFFRRMGTISTEPVALKGGESHNAGLVKLLYGTDLRVCDATITGRVVDEHGKPIKGREISARLPGYGFTGTIADHRGRFELKGLPRGDVAIRAHYTPDGAGTLDDYYHQKMQAPATDVQFQVLPPGWQFYGKEPPEIMVEHWINGPDSELGHSLGYHKGKPILLVLGTDIRGQPYIRGNFLALHEKYKGKGLVVIVINRHFALKGGNEPKACEGLDRNGLIVGIDAHSRDLPENFGSKTQGYGATDHLYGLQKYAGYSGDGFSRKGAMFLIDKKGILRTAVTRSNVEQKIEALLQE